MPAQGLCDKIPRPSCDRFFAFLKISAGPHAYSRRLFRSSQCSTMARPKPKKTGRRPRRGQKHQGRAVKLQSREFFGEGIKNTPTAAVGGVFGYFSKKKFVPPAAVLFGQGPMWPHGV